MSQQALLNSYTGWSAAQSITQIMQRLAKHGAQAILQEFGPEGRIAAISFRINTEFGVLTFRLPCEADKVYAVIVREKLLTKAKQTREHANAVAWRITLDWLDAQLAMIYAGLVALEQVFLPYMQGQDGVTVYEVLQRSKFKLLER